MTVHQDITQFQAPLSKKRLPHSTLIYSKDRGVTWQSGQPAYPDTTEAQLVELEPGVLMLNCRYNRKSTRLLNRGGSHPILLNF